MLDLPWFIAYICIVAAVLFMSLLDVPDSRLPPDGRIIDFPEPDYPGHNDE